MSKDCILVNPSGNDNKKRKKSFYQNFSNKRTMNHKLLQVGLKGFMLTCNYDEKRCVREAYNLLNEYIESVEEQKTEDVSDLLNCEINHLKRRNFQQVDTKCKNIVFIECKELSLDIKNIMMKILEDIKESGKQKTQSLLRMLPIYEVSKTSIEDIEKSVIAMLKHYSSNSDTYMIECKVRNNTSFTRTQLIENVAKIVKSEKPDWRVKFDIPKYTLLIEVLQKHTCLTILEDYYQFCKYNLIEYAKKSLTNLSNEDNKNLKEENIS